MLTPLVVETRHRLAEARHRLEDTRRRIEHGRRLLNPAWGISGGAGDLRGSVQDRGSIQDRMERGALSLASRSVAARWGTGQPCIICERSIEASQVANGCLGEDGATLWTHLDCLRVWREETRTYEVKQLDRERSAQQELCAFVRDGFASGAIEVLAHKRSRLGRGAHGRCSVCRQRVSPGETAYEIVGGVLGRPAYAHLVCYRVWWVESLAHRRSRT